MTYERIWRISIVQASEIVNKEVSDLPILISRKIQFKQQKKDPFHTVEKWKIYSHQRIFPSNQLFSNLYSKCVDFTKFLQKKKVEYSTLWKNEKFTLNEIFFRQINSLVICLVKPLLSRNFCRKSVRLKFHNFHTV